MDELEAIRAQKLQRLQERYGAEQQQQAKIAEKIQALEDVVKQHMTKEALSRFGNLKIAHPRKAVQLLTVLGQALREGQLNTIDDDVLKEIVIKLTPQKQEFKIKRV